MLRRIIYISRSLVGADPEEIADIVATSIRLNGEHHVTGMLWADGESFAQVIEGDPGHVGRTMDRICVDRRHTDIAVLLDRAVQSRQFGDWSMRHATDDVACAHGTTFMIGYALGARTASAMRLYDIVLASDTRGIPEGEGN